MKKLAKAKKKVRSKKIVKKRKVNPEKSYDKPMNKRKFIEGKVQFLLPLDIIDYGNELWRVKYVSPNYNTKKVKIGIYDDKEQLELLEDFNTSVMILIQDY